MAVLQIIKVMVLIIIGLGTTLGNFLVFLAVAKWRKLQTKGNLFILNLGVADLLVAVVNMPITLKILISEDWNLGDVVCQASGFTNLVSFVASCMALTAISINRYYGIVYWQDYHKTFSKHKCVVYIIITWGVTIAISLPPLFGWASFHFEESQSYCFVKWADSKLYAAFMVVACLLLPLVIMVYCYLKIIIFKKQSMNSVCAAAPSETTCNTSKRRLYHQSAIARSQWKLTRTVIMLVVTFAVCWSPFAIAILLDVFAGIHLPELVHFVVLAIGYGNSLCNVFVYSVTNSQIKEYYRRHIKYLLEALSNILR